MQTFCTIEEMQRWADGLRREGKSIGFVPTMGALHEGHLSLAERAAALADAVAVSIFVNPTQFAPGEDFDKYPRTLDEDSALLRGRGVDAVFAPSVSEMYPDGFATELKVGGITQVLEGATRPTHFAGVTLVVAKLLLAARPDVAVFGRKDAQQAIVIRRMVRDLNFGVTIDVAPTVREADGLALSSRNRYLGSDERAAAPALSRGLRSAFDAWTAGECNAGVLAGLVRERIDAEPLMREDYVAVVSQDTLQPVDTAGTGFLVAAAVYVGKTRLIDNWWVTADGRAEF